MKRIFMLTLVLFAAFSFSFSAAAESFNTVNDLFQYWEKNGYPDYVCGVWSNDGTMNDLTIAVLEGQKGEEGKNDILKTLRSGVNVKFAYGKYSKNELLRIQNELYEKYRSYDIELVKFSTSLDEMNGYIELGLDIENMTPKLSDYIEECKAQYGDAINIVQCGDFEFCDAAFVMDNTESNVSFVYFIVFMVPVAFMTFFVVKNKKATLLVTTRGDITVFQDLSVKQVEEIIEKSVKSPSDAFDTKMKEYFDKK